MENCIHNCCEMMLLFASIFQKQALKVICHDKTDIFGTSNYWIYEIVRSMKYKISKLWTIGRSSNCQIYEIVRYTCMRVGYTRVDCIPNPDS